MESGKNHLFFNYICNVKAVNLLLVLVVALTGFSSCREDIGATELQVYDGPVNSAKNFDLVQSDSTVIRSHIKAPLQLEFANGNREFPEGVDIQFFDKDGNVTTTFRADKGFYLRDENLYKGVGDVQVENLVKDQSLKAEEIFWNPNDKKIYTEKFVTVRDGQTVFNGTGMEADEGFSNYTLRNIKDSRTLLPGERDTVKVGGN
ncbi:LPS export ABC transporter periplasmic protein LptC [Algoriphagus machipongonensis]|uniref:Lipoprotein n=1 Tax=Algoriphagus machipongonensis TaxID=388413 RepID=A3HU47_9BACT|nr:LPS export ABC transporter periplasmic protein LptC [Algoriphagus machipongonensis]EAZ81669.1 lipoprotein [Algoriphagus machipongonensis]